MNNEKLNSTPKLSIAKREIFRICKDLSLIHISEPTRRS